MTLPFAESTFEEVLTTTTHGITGEQITNPAHTSDPVV